MADNAVSDEAKFGVENKIAQKEDSSSETDEEEEDNSVQKPMFLCQICDENEGKYKCPKCGFRTCSLACVKAHKEKSGCDGIRSKQKSYDQKVQPQNMNTEFLRKDVKFISDGIDTINKLRKRKAQYQVQEDEKVNQILKDRNKKFKKLRNFLRKHRQIMFKSCPSPLMQRNVLNQTYIDQSVFKKINTPNQIQQALPSVSWTVEIQFFSKLDFIEASVLPTQRVLIHGINEHRSIGSFALSVQFWCDRAAEGKVTTEFSEWITSEKVKKLMTSGESFNEESVAAYVQAMKWKQDEAAAVVTSESPAKDDKEEGEMNDSEVDEADDQKKEKAVDRYHKVGLDETLSKCLIGMTIHEYPTLCIGLNLPA